MPRTPDRSLRQLTTSYGEDDEIVVVGGGAAGLAAAFFLLEAGHRPDRISLFERAPYLGGHARSIYLRRGGSGELTVIQDYRMRLSDGLPVLELTDAAGGQEELPVVDNPDLVPVDLGFCGTGVNYQNLERLLAAVGRELGLPPRVGALQRFEVGEGVSFGGALAGLTLPSDKPLWGQLTKPQNWWRIVRMKWDIDRLVEYSERIGPEGLRAKTMGTLTEEWRAKGIGEPAIAYAWAFCQVGSGFSVELFSQVSASYWFSFFKQGNFHRISVGTMLFEHGVSAYVCALTTFLEQRGVRLHMGDMAPAGGRHRILAIQPYDAHALDPTLPLVRSCRSLTYLHHDAGLARDSRLDTTLQYGSINGVTQASWDLGTMRHGLADVGAFVTFTTPDHEAEVDSRLFGDGSPRYLRRAMGNAHDLLDGPLKIGWRHALIDLDAEVARRRIWTERQGKDSTWYCGSSYLECMLHENAITSAMEVVCLLTGRHQRLHQLGYRASAHTLAIHGEGTSGRQGG